MNMPMKHFIGLFITFACIGLSAGDFVVDANSPVQIVLPDKVIHPVVESALKRAASKVANALKVSFGKDVPCVAESKAAPNMKGIYLGNTLKAQQLGLKPADRFNYCIYADDSTLCIVGTDRSRLSNVYNAHRGIQEEFYCGSLRGIVEFCEDYLNVRFLWPGENGTDYAKIKALRVPAGTVHSKAPRMEFAGGGYPTYLDSCYDYALGWYGRGGWQMYGGHSIRNIAGHQIIKDHPECYALINGVRKQQQHIYMCLSNPLVLDAYYEVVRKMLEEGADCYEIGVDDCNVFCQCENCKAVHPIPAERIWIFYRKLAERFAKTHPDKSLVLISYDQTETPPRSFDTFPGNVYIELCRFSDREMQVWKKYKGIKGFSVYDYSWGYYHITGMAPKQTPESIVQKCRAIAGNNIVGFFRCGFGENYGLDGVVYYMQGKLHKDPTLDPKALEREFYRRAFHEAGEVMESFFHKMHAQFSYYPRLLGSFRLDEDDFLTRRVLSKDPREVLQMLWPASLLRILERDLSTAERIAVDPVVKKRLELVRTEFNYNKLLVHALRAYSAYLDQPDQAGFDKVEKAVKERRAFVDSLCDDKGRIKPFPGWPELYVFGSSPMKGFGADRKVLEINGRLGAIIQAPLTWNFENYKKFKQLPDASRKGIAAVACVNPPPFENNHEWLAAKWGRIARIGTTTDELGGWFKMVYDEKNLYVLLSTRIPTGRVYPSKGRNYGACGTDSVELFIDAEGTGQRYYHFLINPVENSFMDGAFGLREDPRDPLYNQYDQSWDGQWSYQTKRGPETDGKQDWWIARIVIPFSTLGLKSKPPKGTMWNLDVGHTRFGTPGDWATASLFLWSAPDGKFHDRSSFCELVFE